MFSCTLELEPPSFNCNHRTVTHCENHGFLSSCLDWSSSYNDAVYDQLRDNSIPDLTKQLAILKAYVVFLFTNQLIDMFVFFRVWLAVIHFGQLCTICNGSQNKKVSFDSQLQSLSLSCNESSIVIGLGYAMITIGHTIVCNWTQKFCCLCVFGFHSNSSCWRRLSKNWQVCNWTSLLEKKILQTCLCAHSSSDLLPSIATIVL
jgi:hypothetical protein